MVFLWTLLPLQPAGAEPMRMPAAPLRTAFGSRCAKSPIPCNRIDYFTASFHLADIVLLPATDSRGWGATIGYGMSMSLFHRSLLKEENLGGFLPSEPSFPARIESSPLSPLCEGATPIPSPFPAGGKGA